MSFIPKIEALTREYYTLSYPSKHTDPTNQWTLALNLPILFQELILIIKPLLLEYLPPKKIGDPKKPNSAEALQ